jgi:ectoine hydroxylase-related dioxygenase (phytanoyl-CoA dioxygenase family)
MSHDDVVERVRAEGFAVLPGVLEADAVDRYRSALQRLIEDDLASGDPRRGADEWMVLNVMLRDELFMDLLVNCHVREVVDALLGPTSILYAFVSSSMPPRGTNYSNRLHVDSQRVIPGYPTNVGVIVALDDFTDDNGATWFLPRSFEQEVVTEDEFWASAVRAYPRAGDAVVFNARTWHSGGTNVTDGPRHAVTMNYVRSYMRQHFDFPRMVPPDEATTLPEELRRVLGFHVRVPTSLEEYYVDPADRLYRAGQG